MIKYFFILAIVFVALIFGHHLIDYQGKVIITTESHVLELRLVSALILIALGAFLLWIFSLVGLKILRAILGSKNWLGGLSRRQKETAFYDAIALMSTNQSDKARAKLKKALGGDFQGADHLLMAQLESDKLQKQKHLAQVQGNASIEVAANVALAESYLPESPDYALATLQEISEKHATNPSVVACKIRVSANLQDWEAVNGLLKANKKTLPEDIYQYWIAHSVKGEFASIASKQGAKALIQHWQSSSRNIQKSLDYQSAFVEQLLLQGMHQEAESFLLQFSKKDPKDKLLPLFYRISLKQATASIRYIENKIKIAPHKAQYYSILANLAYNANDMALALKAVNKAISITNEKRDLLLLAKIHEHKHDQVAANQIYKKIVEEA